MSLMETRHISNLLVANRTLLDYGGSWGIVALLVLVICTTLGLWYSQYWLAFMGRDAEDVDDDALLDDTIHEDLGLAAELRALAQQLPGEAVVSFSRLLTRLRGPEERYAAITPMPERRPDGNKNLEVQRWRYARLDLWESKARFRANAPPTGSLLICKVTDIQMVKEAPCFTTGGGTLMGVTVVHPGRLSPTLFFEKATAERFREVFREYCGKISAEACVGGGGNSD